VLKGQNTRLSLYTEILSCLPKLDLDIPESNRITDFITASNHSPKTSFAPDVGALHFYNFLETRGDEAEIKKYFFENFGVVVYKNKDIFLACRLESHQEYNLPHEHYDYGSYILYIDETAVVTDFGSGSYDNRASRNIFRDRYIHHNITFIDNNTPCWEMLDKQYDSSYTFSPSHVSMTYLSDDYDFCTEIKLKKSAIIIKRRIIIHNRLINYSNDYLLFEGKSFNDEQTNYFIRQC
jgi:hypothetical protein